MLLILCPSVSKVSGGIGEGEAEAIGWASTLALSFCFVPEIYLQVRTLNLLGDVNISAYTGAYCI